MRVARVVLSVTVLALGAAGGASFASEALAQASDVPEITITKPAGGYGAYGPSLPGVYLAQTSGVAPQPTRSSLESPYSWVEPMPVFSGSSEPTGWQDGWHGEVGEGIPLQ
jgi:hypothetical protein